MRVALDASSLLTPQTGIGRYVEQLVRALVVRGGLETSLMCSFRPWARQTARHVHATFGPLGARVRQNPIPNRLLHASWELANWPPAEWIAGDCEVYHATNFIAPPGRHAGVVATVHDLTPLRFPGWHTPYQRLIAHYLPKSVHRSDRVIADSQATADDLIALLGVPAARIRVVPLAAASHFYAPGGADEQAAVRLRHGLTRRYFLFVGTLEPRKNLGTLLAAYQQLSAALQRECELVLVGGRGWEDERLFEAIDAMPGVRWLGRVADAELPALMAGCVGFVYPSRYEGFGLPVLEAMAAGAPVVTSRASSLPEVVGDAALLVDPDDAAGLAAAMRSLAEEADLAEDLRSRGRVRAAGFSWAATAEQTHAVYGELAGRAGG